MNIPTLDELRKMKDGWLNDASLVAKVKNAMTALAVVGDHAMIGTYAVQELQIGGFLFRYGDRELRYNTSKGMYDRQLSLTVQDLSGRCWVRYILVNDIPSDSCHIVPGAWEQEAEAIKKHADEKMQKEKKEADEQERIRLARLLLII